MDIWNQWDNILNESRSRPCLKRDSFMFEKEIINNLIGKRAEAEGKVQEDGEYLLFSANCERKTGCVYGIDYFYQVRKGLIIGTRKEEIGECDWERRSGLEIRGIERG